ncbi:MAG: DUF3306 domain-containing protein [Candidatus Competibacteraceae bacterium]
MKSKAMSKSDSTHSAHREALALQETVGDESFFRRWSTRKQQAAAQPSIKESEAVDTAQPAPSSPELTDADMPPLESLDEKSDYSAFFSPKVSAELKRLALRKLFHSAKFNVTDGLDDYADDFTQFAALGDVITQDMRHMMEVIAKRDASQVALTLEPEVAKFSTTDNTEPLPTGEAITVNDTEQKDSLSEQTEHPA